MSTKVTITYGDSFHLYSECFDDENVYLELEGVSFSVPDRNTVQVCIPLEIWEVIRTHSNFDTSFAGKTEEELLAEIESEVDRRIAQFQNAKTEKERTLINLFGFLRFGDASESREKQIAAALASRLNEKQQQLELLRKIEEVKAQGRKHLKTDEESDSLDETGT